MEENQLPFTAFQLQHRRGWGSDGLLLVIKRVGLLQPARDPCCCTLLLAVDIRQLGLHGFRSSEGRKEGQQGVSWSLGWPIVAACFPFVLGAECSCVSSNHGRPPRSAPW